MSFSVITTVLAPAASYDLTDLATVKDELSIGTSHTSDDNSLRRAITQVSGLIKSYAKRIFVPEYIEDAFDIIPRTSTSRIQGDPDLQLTQWPLIDVAAVVQTQSTGSPLTLAEGADFKVDAATGILTRIDASSGATLIWESLPVAVKYVAGYGSAIGETHSVPSVAPYDITVAQAATYSCDQAVAYANGTLLALVAGSPRHGEYSVAAGVYTFNAADAGQSLTFAYVVSDIPADLVDAALRLVTARYRAKGRDPSLIQRDTVGIGTERFWFGGAPGQTGPFPPDIEALLEPYCMPVVA